MMGARLVPIAAASPKGLVGPGTDAGPPHRPVKLNGAACGNEERSCTAPQWP